MILVRYHPRRRSLWVAVARVAIVMWLLRHFEMVENTGGNYAMLELSVYCTAISQISVKCPWLPTDFSCCEPRSEGYWFLP